ncbi:alpha/beta hydrolase [Pedobacter psychroterrae]|uniref:Alpha/beta fold hydrolase n=1 Tax=Pedobacter psychroterrae TaxID=2530453 RepID=A0A4R0NEB8_9SPHI|nr:alpha/beta fold hydrolase [Pedobacter psychroterrae]TCC98057.1 alpha/beta fold hydrolase [Pedobacter psychroterrae]
MKKVALLFFTLLLTTSAFSQGMLNLFGRSEDYFKSLSEEKYTEAYNFFDDSFKTKISEDNLKDLWSKITEKFGKLENVSVVGTKAQGEYYVVTVEAKFSGDTQNFIIGFNKTDKIVGFFIQPKAASEAYKLPMYADSTLYKETEIYVKTPKHQLVGKLIVPKNATNYPVVVLVHGSGPSDMDESVGANKPFKDLALGLAAKGIASIRYVKRTLVYAGDFSGAFTVKEEVLDDALAAIELARTTPGIDKKQIYLLGHSLGGMLAPRLGALAPDLKGLILLAAPARKLTDIIIDQNKYMFSLAKDTTDKGKKLLDTIILELSQTKITQLGTVKPDSLLLGMPASYWVDLNIYDQVAVAKKLKQRIFIAQGGNDFQVTEQDYTLWKTALEKQKSATVKLYPDLNHLMATQKEKGNSQQYDIPGNVSSVLVDDLAIWIKTK